MRGYIVPFVEKTSLNPTLQLLKLLDYTLEGEVGIHVELDIQVDSYDNPKASTCLFRLRIYT